MSAAQRRWQEVFKYAVRVANKKRRNNPRLTYSQAMKKAWKDPSVLAKKAAYERQKKASKSRSTKKTTTRRVVKNKTTTRKSTNTRKKTTRKKK